MLLSNNESNELVLFPTNSAETSTLSTSQLLSDKIHIKFPADKLYIAYCDSNNNLYLVGLKNKQLFLWVTKFILKKLSTNWRKLTFLDADPDTKASFSKDGAFLFILQSEKTLKIFAHDYNWLQINAISEIKIFPSDINSTAKFMVFVDEGFLQIHGIKTDINSNEKTQLIILFVKPNKYHEELISSISKAYLVGFLVVLLEGFLKLVFLIIQLISVALTYARKILESD